MNEHEYYVSPETTKMMKKAGFDWEIYDGYIIYENGNGFTTEFQTPHNFNGDNGNLFINYGGHKEILSRPTLDVAQRWLREVKGIEVYAHVFYDTYDTSEGWDVYVYEVNHIIKQIEDWINSYDVYHSYEEALEAGIKKVLKLILEKGE